MRKTIQILITAPVDTESGYGHKSREIVDAVIKKWKQEVGVGFLPWGNCANGALNKNPRYQYIHNHRVQLPLPQGYKCPLHIHIGLPTEFTPLGEKNILFTSGVETDRVSFDWVSHINFHKLDLIVVPSEYVKKVLEYTQYTDSNGNVFKINTPVVVVPESFDPEFLDGEVDESFKELVEPFMSTLPRKVFFTAGQIMPRPEPYDDRKNITKLISKFLETFRGDRDVALLIKANGVDDSNITKREMTTYIDKVFKATGLPKEELPSVYYLHGYFTEPQMYHIMNHPRITAHVYLTHGEGFGRFILQSTLCRDKPIIIPSFGGHRDFTTGKRMRLIGGEMRQIPPSAHMGNILIPESQWFNVNDNEVYKELRQVARDSKKFTDAGKLAALNKVKFDLFNVQNQIVEAIEPMFKPHREVKLNPSAIGKLSGNQPEKTTHPILKKINGKTNK